MTRIKKTLNHIHAQRPVQGWQKPRKRKTADAIREADAKIQADITETVNIVRNGYRCIPNCYLHTHRRTGGQERLCKGRPGQPCPSDLSSQFYHDPFMLS